MTKGAKGLMCGRPPFGKGEVGDLTDWLVAVMCPASKARP